MIKSRVRWTHPINVPDFEFIRANTKLIPKITIPGPCALHFRGGDAAVLAGAYKDLDQFWDDTVEAFGQELKALADAGCRYVQIDETAFAKFGDPEVQASLKARGDDWSALIDKYVAVTNRVLKNAPAGMRIGMHLCRGNRGGQWHSEGSYDSVAERLFNALNIPFYFLEYDSPRAGTFTPLRLVPRHKTVVLGLVSTKTPAMENKDELREARRGRDAPSRSRLPRGQPAMRLRQHRHRQPDHAGGAGAEAPPGGGAGARHLGRGVSSMRKANHMRLTDSRPGAGARPARRRAGAGRALAHPSGAADRGLGPRRQSRRAGAPARGKIHHRVRQAVHRRERAGRRRHRRRQHGRQVAARRSCADVRRFRRDGDQPGAQSEPRLRPDQGLRAGHRAGQPADHHVGQSRPCRPTRSRSSSRSPRRSPAR